MHQCKAQTSLLGCAFAPLLPWFFRFHISAISRLGCMMSVQAAQQIAPVTITRNNPFTARKNRWLLPAATAIAISAPLHIRYNAVRPNGNWALVSVWEALGIAVVSVASHVFAHQRATVLMRLFHVSLRAAVSETKRPPGSGSGLKISWEF